ncbi:MAG: TM2 domain-containing protein [Candidatus Lokiarchaeota archaeon]|nr:TM2 domain-containing protein [Candidatus Harpocratesius repetitus]
MQFCPNCGAKVDEITKFCPYCGTKLNFSQSTSTASSSSASSMSGNSSEFQGTYQQPISNNVPPATASLGVEKKDRIVAALLAIFLGAFGIHKFYLGNITMGIIYLCLSWTGITGIIGFIEGIIYLTKTDEEFYRDHVLPIEQRA